MNDYQHHIYILRPVRTGMVTDGPDEHETPILAAHYKYLMDLGEAGQLSVFGRTANNDETTIGLVLINSDVEADARSVMENDPAVEGGVMSAALFPFRMAFPQA